MKLSSQTMMIVGASVLVVVAVIVAVVLMKKKEKFEFTTGQMVVSATSTAQSIFSNQTQVMKFINFVHQRIGPNMSISFSPTADDTIPSPHIGKIQITAEGVAGATGSGTVSGAIVFGKNNNVAGFWNAATFQLEDSPFIG
jgi:hypothetical protein